MLGFIGLIAISSFLLIIAISCIIITWDTCRVSTPNQRSQYLEFDSSLLEAQSVPKPEDLVTKRTLVCYSLGIFCQYVLPLPRLSNAVLSTP